MLIWVEFARRTAWFTIAVFIAGAAFAGWYAATHLKVNTDTTQMLSPDLPFQQNAEALREAFPQLKNDLIIIIHAPTLDEADAFGGALRDRLITRQDVITSVFAPAQEPFFLENGLLYLEHAELESRLAQMSKAAGLIETLVRNPTADTLFATLVDNDKLAERSELGQDQLAAIYAELADVIDASLEGRRRPFSWMGALDPERAGDEIDLRLVYATPVLDYSRLQPARPAINAVQAEIDALKEQFDGRIEVFITGDPALRAEELQSVTTGIGISFLISILLVSCLLMFAFRSWVMAGLTLVSLVITLTLTSAFAASAVGELNLVSIAFTVLLVGLGLDFAIHLLLHIQERRAAGQPTRRALFGAVREVGPALAMAAPTTALAFFSFVPTRFDGIAQLGVIAGVGVLIAFFVSITFLPAALGALPRPKPGRQRPARKVRGVMDGLSGPVAIVTIVLGMVAIYFVPQARLDADPMSLRDPSSQSVQGFRLLFDDTDTIPYRLSLLAASAEEAVAASTTAKKLEVVGAARSLPDFVPEDQDEKLDLIDFAAGSLVFALEATPDLAASPGSAGGAAALEARLRETYADGAGARLAAALALATADAATMTRVEAEIFRFWPALIERLKRQFRANYVDIDTLPAALSTRYRSAEGLWRVDILPQEDVRDRAALNRFVDTVEAAFPDVSGGAIQNRKAGAIISEAMLQATSIALGVIAIFLWLIVRRTGLVLLMLMPLALAAALTAAAGVILDIPFNYANVIVLPLLIGIGVDSGIHLVMRHEHAREGETIFGTATPRAVLFSALTTVASFASLMLSPHRGTASMGELLSIAIAFTLLCTLFVLPAAFRWGSRRNRRPETAR
jgi:hopanoid biosynthesis associated RND transporter like protein HpnN